MTDPAIDALGNALFDLLVLGEVVDAIAIANSGNGRDVVPSTWVAWFGRELTRLATDAGDARDTIRHGPAT